jgi:lipopolysaccharide biosynthesis regulator YciM
MRAMLLLLALLFGIATGAPRAHAMTAGTASALEAALAQQSLVQDAAYICRHRFYTSRRICWWRPSWRYWRR